MVVVITKIIDSVKSEEKRWLQNEESDDPCSLDEYIDQKRTAYNKKKVSLKKELDTFLKVDQRR